MPTDGPAVITPNHLSFCDSVFVPAALPRRVWAIGKGEYMDSWKTKHLFPAMGMIPVDRSGGDAAQAALDAAADVLQHGRLFMIYPEGTRSRSGNLHKGRTGAARLALRCNAPIIPVGPRGHRRGAAARHVRDEATQGGRRPLRRSHVGARVRRPRRSADTASVHRCRHVRDRAAVGPEVRRHLRRQGRSAR